MEGLSGKERGKIKEEIGVILSVAQPRARPPKSRKGGDADEVEN